MRLGVKSEEIFSAQVPIFSWKKLKPCCRRSSNFPRLRSARQPLNKSWFQVPLEGLGGVPLTAPKHYICLAQLKQGPNPRDLRQLLNGK